jgi:ABC-type Zn uptake system ZnuABC Zn-binding protein ZnuA
VLRPTFDREFDDRTGYFVSQIDSMVDQYRPKFDQAIIRKVLVLSTDFNLLLNRFGLQPIQPVTALPMELNDSAMRALKSAASQNQTRVLLVPIDTPPAIMRDIETRGGLQVVPIDRLGSSAAGGHNSYLSMLRFNLEQLLTATSVR